jgi:hypothetical protein
MHALRRKLQLSALGAGAEEVGERVAAAAAAVAFTDLARLDVAVSGAPRSSRSRSRSRSHAARGRGCRRLEFYAYAEHPDVAAAKEAFDRDIGAARASAPAAPGATRVLIMRPLSLSLSL